MARARTIFATMLLALGACSGKSEPTVDSNRASDRDSADARSPDAILQARLQQAVRDIDKREARRGPDALFLRTGHALGLAGEMALAPPSAEPSAAAPNVRQGSSPASGRLPAEVVQRVVRANFGKLQACYETALRANPNLTARVKVAFTIGRDGTTGDVSETTDIDDKTFTSCIRAGFSSMSFPEPDGGVVRVTYPLQFTPDGVPAPRSSTATPPADFPPSPGAERERRKLADPMGPWPIVTVDKNHFRLDGESTGSSKETIESGKLHKVDALFEAMKKRREDWKAAHPDMSFPGVVGLRVEADVPVVAFKSAFQTLAYAGFPNVFVQSAADSEQIVEIAAQIPGPPDFELKPQLPVLDLHLFVTSTDVSLTWRQGEVMPEPERKAPLDADLPELVCNSWRQKGSHREATDERQDRFVLHADDTAPFEQIERVTRGVLACTRAREGAPAPIPAFWFQLAMR